MTDLSTLNSLFSGSLRCYGNHTTSYEEKFLLAGFVSDLKALRTMLVPQLVLVLAAVGGSSALLLPINLTLCEKTSENVSRFLTDLYLVQPQQHDSCELANTSAPVVSHHHPPKHLYTIYSLS